jgi:hypothetical protein
MFGKTDVRIIDQFVLKENARCLAGGGCKRQGSTAGNAIRAEGDDTIGILERQLRFMSWVSIP